MKNFKEYAPKNTIMGRPLGERKVIKGIVYKKCPKCSQWLPLTEYHQRSAVSENKQCYCKPCALQYNRQYHQKRRGSKTI